MICFWNDYNVIQVYLVCGFDFFLQVLEVDIVVCLLIVMWDGSFVVVVNNNGICYVWCLFCGIQVDFFFIKNCFNLYVFFFKCGYLVKKICINGNIRVFCGLGCLSLQFSNCVFS